MRSAELVALVALCALVAYGVLAGADFGGGVWDLFARGPRKSEQREAIARAMGPVWEANHVWLIFVVVLLFAGFPSAWEAINLALFVPLHLALVGIILRGASFVFRAYGPQTEGRSVWGAVFGGASVVTPFVLGQCLGAVSSGGIRVIHGALKPGSELAWYSPLSLATGAFATSVCAYLAAVYLTLETVGDLREDFRRRALGSGTVVVALSALVLPLLKHRASHLWEGLTGPRALPVLLLGALAALASGLCLRLRRYPLARAATVLQVSFLLLGWGLAEYPYILFPDLRVTESAAPEATLRWLLITLVPGGLLLVPSLALLFRVFKSRGTTRPA